MVFAVDFDGTVVSDARPYADTETPLVFIPGAREALLALRRAGHTLLLWSARSSPALIDDPALNPLVRVGAVPESRARWEAMRHVHLARLAQMLAFVERELPEVFDAIDDGRGGKPVGVDFFLDDKALRLGRGTGGFGWGEIAEMYGEPDHGKPVGRLSA